MNKDNYYNDDLDSSDNEVDNTNFQSSNLDDLDNFDDLGGIENLNNSEANSETLNQSIDSIENPTDFNFESGVKYSSNRQSTRKANSQSNSRQNSNTNSNINSKTEKKASLKEAFQNSEFYIFFKVWLNINRWGLFVYIIIVSFCVVFFVSNVREVTKLLDDIVKLNKYKNEINSKNKILEVKLVEMQSPERINKIAIEQLGFEKATEAPFYIDKSK